MSKLDFKSILWRIKYWCEEVSLGIRNVFRKNSVRKIRNLCIFLLGVLFVIAIFFHNMGRFTVTVDSELQKRGIYLFESIKFENPKTRLFSVALEECDNININDLPLDLNEKEGNCNGKNYIAYTFYLKNGGQEVVDYEYSLNIGDSTKNVDEAVWILLYKNGEYEMFAKARADGTFERQYTYDEYEILSQANKSDEHIYNLSKEDNGLLTIEDKERLGIYDVDGLMEIRASKFVSDNIITKEIVKDFKPGEYDKYTVVAWLEGEDPECVDAIKGGYVEMNMKFDIVEEEE